MTSRREVMVFLRARFIEWIVALGLAIRDSAS